MARPTEAPVVTEESGPIGGTIERHPAFGQIVASRIQGHVGTLYGSEFNHQHSVRITLSSSSVRRSLSNDWHHGEKELFEVELSEAQWASFVSSVSVGSGVPCTLRHIQGQHVPGITPPQKRSEQFGKEMRENFDDACKYLSEVRAMLDASGLSKVKQKEIISKLNMVEREIGSSVEFVADMFDEHMETTTEKAKMEVNAYATNIITRAGLAAIAGSAPIISIGHDDGVRDE